jgi:hypothetical protein
MLPDKIDTPYLLLDVVSRSRVSSKPRTRRHTPLYIYIYMHV